MAVKLFLLSGMAVVFHFAAAVAFSGVTARKSKLFHHSVCVGQTVDIIQAGQILGRYMGPVS